MYCGYFNIQHWCHLHRILRSRFPDGVITYNEFRDLSAQVLEPTEVEAFCRNVFRMFDSNKDLNLTFDEFTVATTAKDSSPAEKLAWLFDHVYDKVNHVLNLTLKLYCKDV